VYVLTGFVKHIYSVIRHLQKLAVGVPVRLTLAVEGVLIVAAICTNCCVYVCMYACACPCACASSTLPRSPHVVVTTSPLGSGVCCFLQCACSVVVESNHCWQLWTESCAWHAWAGSCPVY